MTEFNIDLLHPGQFTRTRAEWFIGLQGRRRLGLAYAIVALFVLVLVVGWYYIVDRFAPLQAVLRDERQRLAELQTEIGGQDEELKKLQGLLPGLSEIETFQVAWAAVLRALSDWIPKDHWLNRIELVQPEEKPGAASATKPPPIFRLEGATELKPGSASALGVAEFLDGLKQDPRFSKVFQLQDWEASPDVGGQVEQRQQRIMLTVRFKKLP